MQRRPSVVYIRQRCCRRRTVRSALVFTVLLILLLCLGVRLVWALIWAGLLTLVVRRLIGSQR